MNSYRFNKETNGRWYVDIPSWVGPKSALEMVAGADKMLDILAENNNFVGVLISELPFSGGDLLEFIRTADEVGEGSFYLLKTYQGSKLNLEMWLCDVMLHVFGKFPKTLYIQKIGT